MEESTQSSSILAKVFGGIFAAVIAPTITGVIVWFIQKKLDSPQPDLPANPTVQAGAVPGTSAPRPPQGPPKELPKVVAGPSAPEPIPKKEAASVPAKVVAGPDASAPVEAKRKEAAKEVAKPVLASSSTPSASSASTPSPAIPKKKGLRARLFNGKDLTGFVPFFGTAPGEGGKATGRSPAPESVFFVRDGELHVTGKVFGGLVSVRDYENYHLVVEYKWGEKKWPPRDDLPRISGVVLHATGPPGAVRGWSMAGITCVIGELDSGALLLPEVLPNPISLRAPAERLLFKKGTTMLVYKPGEPLTTVQSGFLHRLGYRPPLVMAKTVAGKVAKDLINPVGEWNKLECICEGDKITVILNGNMVNAATKVTQSRGKLFIESQGAEISFRTITVRPLPGLGLPKAKAQFLRP